MQSEHEAGEAARVPAWGIRVNPLRLVLGLAALALVWELGFLIWVQPEWGALRQGLVPASALIKAYEIQRDSDRKLPVLKWKPLRQSLPNRIKQAFVLSEDSRFYEHGGIDFQAIQDAFAYNWKHKKLLLGASTISQQTAKNMFLSLSRNPLRKFNELILTMILESRLSKAEIIHIYLNIAEFGPGIFGIEAAAKTYYQTSAHKLSQAQAIELAASLPSPKKNNPRTRTRFFQRHVARLTRTYQAIDSYAKVQPRAADAAVLAAAAADLAKKLQELRELNAAEADPSSEAMLAPGAEGAIEQEELLQGETKELAPSPAPLATDPQSLPADAPPDQESRDAAENSKILE